MGELPHPATEPKPASQNRWFQMKYVLLATLLMGGSLALSACAQETGYSRPTAQRPIVPAASAPAPGGGMPAVSRQSNGATAVRYTNGCTVTYSKDGRRSGSQGCRPEQVERADRAVQEETSDRGGGGLNFQKLKTGAGQATFNDGCTVTYGKDGRRSGSQGCTPKQVARADKAAQQQW